VDSRCQTLRALGERNRLIIFRQTLLLVLDANFLDGTASEPISGRSVGCRQVVEQRVLAGLTAELDVIERALADDGRCSVET
jgi:hypothetical protein